MPSVFLEHGHYVDASDGSDELCKIDVTTFDEKYGDCLSQEQLTRECYVSTGTITSWIKKGKIKPTVSYPFGSKQIYSEKYELNRRCKYRSSIR